MTGMTEGRLIFDGDCGFCTRCAGWLRRMDYADRIEIRPYQASGVPESVGATPEECAASVQWLGLDGRRRSGAEAVNAALSLATGTPLFSRLYGATSVVQEWVYTWVADHRSHFPGTTPHCASRPGDCAR